MTQFILVTQFMCHLIKKAFKNKIEEHAKMQDNKYYQNQWQTQFFDNLFSA